MALNYIQYKLEWYLILIAQRGSEASGLQPVAKIAHEQRSGITYLPTYSPYRLPEAAATKREEDGL